MTDADEARSSLSRLEVVLAELKYVDDALAALDQHNLHFPRDVLFDWMPVKIGWTNEFEEHFKYEATSRESANAAIQHWESTLTRLRNDAASWAESSLSHGITQCQAVLDTRGDNLAGAASSLTGVGESTEILQGDFGLLDASLGHWHGMAATAFGDFYNSVKGAVVNHAWMAGQIAAHTAAAGELVSVGQKSIRNAAEAGEAAAREQLKQRAETRGSWKGVKDFVALIGVVSDLVGLLPAVGDSAEKVLSGVGSIMGYAKDYVPEDKSNQKQEIKKADAQGISMDVTVALAQTKSGWDKTWEDLERRVTDLRTHLDETLKGHTSGYLWIPPRPALADGPVPPTDFEHASAS